MNKLEKFISSARPSRGPAEHASGEFTSYQDSDLDVKFLLALIKEKTNFKHIVCIPDFVLCVDSHLNVRHLDKSQCTHPGHSKIRAGILLVDTHGRPHVVAPSNLQKYVNSCKVKFIVLNLGLYAHGFEAESGHANVLLIDRYEKTIERFEPMTFGNQHLSKTENILESHLKTLLRDYRYVGVRHSVDGKSIQDVVDAHSGMCVTIGLIYVLIRLLNPQKDAASLYFEVMQTSAKQMKSIVLRLNGFVASKLRQYSLGTLSRSRRGRSKRGRTNRVEQKSKTIIRRGHANTSAKDLFFVTRF